MPINYKHDQQYLLNTQYSAGDDNTDSISRSMGESSPFPLLVTHMMERAVTSSELLVGGGWSFREMLDKLLSIVTLPVKQALKKVGFN